MNLCKLVGTAKKMYVKIFRKCSQTDFNVTDSQNFLQILRRGPLNAFPLSGVSVCISGQPSCMFSKKKMCINLSTQGENSTCYRFISLINLKKVYSFGGFFLLYTLVKNVSNSDKMQTVNYNMKAGVCIFPSLTHTQTKLTHHGI